MPTPSDSILYYGNNLDILRNRDMEAASAGFYESEHFGVFPRVQILSIEQLLHKGEVKMPRYQVTFKERNG